MKQSWHVTIIRIVQQINEEMIWKCLQNYCQSSCAKVIKLTQHKHWVDLQLQLELQTTRPKDNSPQDNSPHIKVAPRQLA